MCARCVMDTSRPGNQLRRTRRLQPLPAATTALSDDRLPGGQRCAARLDASASRASRPTGRARTYDCIIGLSGGVDSSYLAYLARRSSACGRWSFTSTPAGTRELAVNNIEKLVEDARPRPAHRRGRLGRDAGPAARLLQGAGCQPATSRRITHSSPRCTTSRPSTAFEYILNGGNYSTECVLPLAWGYHALRPAPSARHPSQLRHAPAEAVPADRISSLTTPTIRTSGRRDGAAAQLHRLQQGAGDGRPAATASAGATTAASTTSRASRASSRATICRRSSATTSAARTSPA